jgi:hypothetical protein
MQHSPCALDCLLDGDRWASVHFGKVDLKDRRRNQRLVALAAKMACNPHMSLPKLLPDWSDLFAAYRLLSNMSVQPRSIVEAHLQHTRQLAMGCAVVLDIQDDTQLDFTTRSDVEGLGLIGDGHGRGLLQHSGLAVIPDSGQVLGLLDVSWHSIQPVKEKETRRQRQSRWTATDVWQETAQRIGTWAADSMLVHVGDRGADVFRFMNQSRKLNHHFVVRAVHDRHVDKTAVDKNEPALSRRLWDKLATQNVLGQITVSVGTQRDGNGKIKRKGRQATLNIRSAPVSVPPPVNDPRTKDEQPLDLWAIYLSESNAPEGQEPIEWMLLTSLGAQTLEQATQLIGYYTWRWKIEEWHRCLKQGCRIEQSQLDHAMDLQRLAAIQSVLAVRLLQLRDLADAQQQPQPTTTKASAATQKANRILQQYVPALYLLIVAQLAKVPTDQLTPQLFLLTIAKRGGYLNRKHDHRPGWIVLWRGWTDIVQMAQGAELYKAAMRQP